MAYGYYGGTNCLYVSSEWIYTNSGSGSYQWANGAVEFELSVTRYTASGYPNSPLSTNLYTYTCTTGEWMVEQWNPTMGRISGSKYIQLEGGYIYALVVMPKAYGNYKSGYYSNWEPFVWTGQQQEISVNLLHPGDW